MTQNEIIQIIEEAKSGNEKAKEAVVKLIQHNGYIRIISRYLYLNRLLEPEDVRAEFWLGVISALPKVKSNVGDPLFYLAWRGANRVKSQLRKNIGRGVVSICMECGWRGRLHKTKTGYCCPKCKSEDLRNYQKEINETTVFADVHIKEKLELKAIKQKIKESAEFKIDIEYFTHKLSPQELRVFKMITEESINRDHEQNYIMTIAGILQISPQCVNQYLRRIREKLLDRPFIRKPKSTI